MKKIISVLCLCIGILSIGLFGGCKSSNKVLNEITKLQNKHDSDNKKNKELEKNKKVTTEKEVLNENNIQKENIKEESENTKSNEDIFICNHAESLHSGIFSSSNEYLIIRETKRNEASVFKDNKLLYTMKDNYLDVKLTPIGDNFICSTIDREKKQIKYEMFNTENGRKEELFFEANEFLDLKKWTDKGIVLKKLIGWAAPYERVNKLFILNNEKEIKELWDIPKEYQNYFGILDVKGYWMLLNNEEKRTLQKMNLKDKKIIDTNFTYEDELLVHKAYFGETENEIVAQFANKGYFIVLFKNENKEIIENAHLLGVTNDGVVYKRFDKKLDKGKVYLRKFKWQKELFKALFIITVRFQDVTLAKLF